MTASQQAQGHSWTPKSMKVDRIADSETERKYLEYWLNAWRHIILVSVAVWLTLWLVTPLVDTLGKPINAAEVDPGNYVSLALEDLDHDLSGLSINASWTAYLPGYVDEEEELGYQTGSLSVTLSGTVLPERFQVLIGPTALLDTCEVTLLRPDGTMRIMRENPTAVNAAPVGEIPAVFEAAIQQQSEHATMSAGSRGGASVANILVENANDSTYGAIYCWTESPSAYVQSDEIDTFISPPSFYPAFLVPGGGAASDSSPSRFNQAYTVDGFNGDLQIVSPSADGRESSDRLHWSRAGTGVRQASLGPELGSAATLYTDRPIIQLRNSRNERMAERTAVWGGVAIGLVGAIAIYYATLPIRVRPKGRPEE